jgi:hypothetical protein
MKNRTEDRFAVLEAREKGKLGNRKSAALIGAVDVGEAIVEGAEVAVFTSNPVRGCYYYVEMLL